MLERSTRLVLLATALLFVIAFIATGCTATAQATPDLPTKEQMYLEIVQEHFQNRHVSISDKNALFWAQDSCYLLDHGATFGELMDYITPHSEPTQRAYAGALGAAIAIFCPQHMNQIRSES